MINNAVEIKELNKRAERKTRRHCQYNKRVQADSSYKRERHYIDCVSSRQSFKTLQGEGKVNTNSRKIEDPQEHHSIYNQPFKVY